MFPYKKFATEKENICKQIEISSISFAVNTPYKLPWMAGKIWQYKKYKKTDNGVFGTLEISISCSSKAFETHTKINFSENISRKYLDLQFKQVVF